MKKDSKPINEQILQSRYLGAIDFLKKQATGNDSKKLFDVPWHFILSTSDSGKNTLLEHTELDFVLKRKNQAPSANHCEWWATKQTIFVDVNQQYCSTTVTKKQQKMWHDFLKLTQQTKKQPITALWLVLDLPTILLTYKENKKNFGLMLKNRIKDLSKQLNNDFPIYIIINKMDLLKGFIDFFDDLSNKERAKPWGMSFETKQTTNSQRLVEHFETEFNEILKTLNLRVIHRLHQERNLNKRVNIKDFPLQMESIKKPLTTLLQVLSGSITANSDAILRGIYFTACEPNTLTEDRLLTPLANTFSLANYNANQYIAAQQDYFVKKLFPNVILPDVHRYNETKTKKQSSPTKIWKYATAITACAIIIGCSGLFIHTYLTQNNDIRLAEDALAQYEAINSLQGDFSIHTNLLGLNKLNQAYQVLANEQFSSLTKLTEKDLTALPENAQKAYAEALQKVIATQLEQIIKQQTSASKINADELYGALKAYLMLTDNRRYQAGYLKQWLQNYWQYQGKVNADDLALLNTHVDNFTKLFSGGYTINQNLVIKARERLSKIPSAALINIILENNNNQAPLNIVLQSKHSIFTTKDKATTISSIYTAKSFEHVYDTVLPQTANQLQQGDWVTGRQGFGINLDKAMLMKIRQQYVSNYIEAWDNIIGQLQLAPIKSYQQSIVVMQSLIKPSQEVKSLMATIYDNTNVSYHNVGTPISQHFSMLDKVVYLFKRSQNKNLNMVISYIQNIIESDNTSITAFEFVKNQNLLSPKQNPFDNMINIAKQAPEPIKSWTNSLLTDIWQLLLNDSAITINTAWNNNVYQYYQANLAGEYPFNPHATKDANMAQFNQLMSQNGIFPKFYNLYLSDFINKDFYGAKLPFSKQALQQITTLQNASNLFYNNQNPDTFSFEFTLAPEKITGDAKAVNLDLDQQAATYSHTYMSSTHFAWPGQNQQHFASMIFVGNNGAQQSITKTGAWAIFKLLSPSESKTVERDNQTIETHVSLPEFSLNYALTENGDQENPFKPGLLIGLVVPESLLIK